MHKWLIDSRLKPQYSQKQSRKIELGSSVFFLEKRLPFAKKTTPICGVHLQQVNRRSANRTATDNKDSVALRSAHPTGPAEDETVGRARRFPDQVHSVRSLVHIAVVAGESEVFAVVSSAMLASNDVLDVIGRSSWDLRCSFSKKATVREDDADLRRSSSTSQPSLGQPHCDRQ